MELNLTEEKLIRLKEDFTVEKYRYDKIKMDGIVLGPSKYQEEIDQINKEKLIEQIEESLYSSKKDGTAMMICENRLIRLKYFLDQANTLKWPKKGARSKKVNNSKTCCFKRLSGKDE